MWTLLLIGNSQSYAFSDYMGTPRSYPEHAVDETVSNSAGPGPDRVYPVVLTNVQEMPAVVIGGGPVGERKVRGLLAAGVPVYLISPQATPQLQLWAREGHIHWEQRPYRSEDCASARLVFAATNHREVNAQIADDARKTGTLCNVADDPSVCDFHVPAVYRNKRCVVAVSTRGESPTEAQRIRDHIAELFT